LTPEFVEEEAIRGDIVLRGAVVLLALLFGWTNLADTSLLTRIRTGQYLASHGILPPRTDVFSSTATDRPWYNLAWLGDLCLAGLYQIGGDSLLTVWTAVASAAAFWLIGRTAMPGIPTWWNSIIAAAAVVAAFPWLTAGPEVVTILGMALLLWVLHRPCARGRHWGSLAGLFFLWSNVDPHAWIGLVVLWAFAIGSLRSKPAEGRPIPAGKPLIKGAAAATIAAMVHPFHWHVLQAPWLQYAYEYPAGRLYKTIGTHFPWIWQPLTSPVFWRTADLFAITAIALAGLALMMLLLNFRKLSLGHVLAWLFINLIALGAGHFLPVAAVVNAVIAGLNGQAWYSRTFRQTYSIAWTELAFSRGGRAITVFGLFALAYLMMNGAITGADGRRLGFGFDWRIETAIESLNHLNKDAFDDHPFNGRVEQGDQLIWTGLKPFVDTRLSLFAHGPSDLLQTHRATWAALTAARDEQAESGQPDVWKKTFSDYKISRVLSRLTGEDGLNKYRLLALLMTNPEMRLTRLDAAAAEVCRTDTGSSPELKAYVEKNGGGNFIEQAFATDAEPLPGLPAWPRELTTYDRWLIQPESIMPMSGQLSQHYWILATQLPPRLAADQRPAETAFALRMLAVREGRRALRQDPNNHLIYRLLGNVYQELYSQEKTIAANYSVEHDAVMRVHEMLAAYYGALLTSPQKATDHEQLGRILASLNYRDVALYHLQQLRQLTGDWTTVSASDPDYARRRDENRELARVLGEQVKSVDEQVNAELDKGSDPMAVAQRAAQAGCPQQAIKLLTENETEVAQNPSAALFFGQLLMIVGRTEDAWERLEEMERIVPKGSDLQPMWRTICAFVNLAYGDYARADVLLSADLYDNGTSRVRALLEGSPLMSSIALRQDLFATTRTLTAVDALLNFPTRFATSYFLRSLVELEVGQNKAAVDGLSRIINYAPDAALRPLAVAYLFLCTGRMESVVGPGNQIPIWEGIFAADSTTDAAKSPVETPPQPPVQAIPIESTGSDKVENSPPP
jgi:hypothetical protein